MKLLVFRALWGMTGRRGTDPPGAASTGLYTGSALKDTDPTPPDK